MKQLHYSCKGCVDIKDIDCIDACISWDKFDDKFNSLRKHWKSKQKKRKKK